METASISTHIDALSSTAQDRTCTDEEVDECIAIMERISELSIERFTEYDFFEDTCGVICNKQFFDGCPLLFIIWHDPKTPVMVYNEFIIDRTKPREEQEAEWVSIWGCMYYSRTRHPGVVWDKAWCDIILPRLKKHIWVLQLGMY